jgi:hypothetical protein
VCRPVCRIETKEAENSRNTLGVQEDDRHQIRVIPRASRGRRSLAELRFFSGGQGVAGSNPVSPTSKKPRNYADLACSGAFLFGSARFKSCHPDKKAQVRSGFLAWASSFPGLHCSGPQKSWLLRSAPSLLLALVARGDQTWPISLGSRGTNPGMGRCRGAISGSAGFHLWSDPGCPGRLGLPSRRLGEEGVCLACGVEQMSGVRVEVEPGRLDRSGAQHLLKYV